MKIKAIDRSLNVGDKITVSVTHQIAVNGDNSWIRYEASSTVNDGESAEDARQRVSDHVDQSVMETVNQVVATVRKVS